MTEQQRLGSIMECLGTFALVFIGTLAVTMAVQGAAVTNFDIAISFGVVVASGIYALGRYGHAHFNPAVSVAFWRAGIIDLTTAIYYMISQLLGAALGAYAVRMLLGDNAGLTLPTGVAWPQALAIEVILTAGLVLVIFVAANHHGRGAGAIIGTYIFLAALLLGPLEGASMNPARSFGPALSVLNFDYLWLYVVGPIIGGWFGQRLYYYAEATLHRQQ